MMENFQRDFGIRVLHAWGMTETSPIGHRLAAQVRDAGLARGAAAGRPAQAGHPGGRVEIRILGDHGEDLPWDGEHVGELVVRGPWIASQLLQQPRGRRRVHRRRLVPHRRHGEHRSATATSSSPTARKT